MMSLVIEPAISLALFYLAYVLFLKRMAFFRANRFYLLSAILFSLALPHIKFAPPVTVTTYSFFIPEVTTGQGTVTAEETAKQFTLAGTIILVYFAGAALLFLRLLFRLVQLWVLATWNRARKHGRAWIVCFNSDQSPFSFFNYIFLNESLYSDEEKQKILEHELAHIGQYHTFDLLLLELLTIIQWFNPVAWLYRRSMLEVHEYLADEEVIKNGTNISFYQSMLAGLQLGRDFFPTASNFNKSLTLNRIRMMTAVRPPSWKKVRFLFLLPTLLLLVLMCTKEEIETGIIPSVPAGKATSLRMPASESRISVPRSQAMPIPEDRIITAPDEGIVFDPARIFPGEQEVFFIVEDMPGFQGGGQDGFRDYIAANLRYPQIAAENGIQGRVFVQFIVNTEGRVEDARIVRGVEESLDREAIRVVMASPLWTPGRQRGSPVNVAFTFPINFVLQ